MGITVGVIMFLVCCGELVFSKHVSAHSAGKLQGKTITLDCSTSKETINTERILRGNAEIRWTYFSQDGVVNLVECDRGGWLPITDARHEGFRYSVNISNCGLSVSIHSDTATSVFMFACEKNYEASVVPEEQPCIFFIIPASKDLVSSVLSMCPVSNQSSLIMSPGQCHCSFMGPWLLTCENVRTATCNNFPYELGERLQYVSTMRPTTSTALSTQHDRSEKHQPSDLIYCIIIAAVMVTIAVMATNICFLVRRRGNTRWRSTVQQATAVFSASTEPSMPRSASVSPTLGAPQYLQEFTHNLPPSLSDRRQRQTDQWALQPPSLASEPRLDGNRYASTSPNLCGFTVVHEMPSKNYDELFTRPNHKQPLLNWKSVPDLSTLGVSPDDYIQCTDDKGEKSLRMLQNIGMMIRAERSSLRNVNLLSITGHDESRLCKTDGTAHSSALAINHYHDTTDIHLLSRDSIDDLHPTTSCSGSDYHIYETADNVAVISGGDTVGDDPAGRGSPLDGEVLMMPRSTLPGDIRTALRRSHQDIMHDGNDCGDGADAQSSTTPYYFVLEKSRDDTLN